MLLYYFYEFQDILTNGFYIFQNGTLKIIDRKKHIFKLSQGEYIAPEKIENIYVRSQYVAQVFVHGESLKVSAGVFGRVVKHCFLITTVFKGHRDDWLGSQELPMFILWKFC